MITLYIVRHGETVDNLERRIQGHSDSPLSALGLRQVDAVADRLSTERFSAVYSSDLGRAMTTAHAIASRRALPVISTDLLREAYLGEAQGLTLEEFERRYPQQFRLWRTDSVAHRPPGAEALESVIERCGRFLRRLADERADGDRVAVVVHGGSLRGLICAALGLPAGFYRSIHSANAGLTILDIGDRPALWLLNDTCHLDGLAAAEEETDNAHP